MPTDSGGSQRRGTGQSRYRPRADRQRHHGRAAGSGRDATIEALDDRGQMRVLRPGTGPFTCMPDHPMMPGDDPMCLDRNGMEWARAWMSRAAPPGGKAGFGDMLTGGSDASNDDPHATAPAPGRAWVETGPHVMILNPGSLADGYPRPADDPRQPYVMWPGTPYGHIMIPVR